MYARAKISGETRVLKGVNIGLKDACVLNVCKNLKYACILSECKKPLFKAL